MFFPESFLRLQSRDIQSRYLQPLTFNLIVSSAATTVSALYLVPQERFAVFQTIVATAEPDPAQSVTRVLVEALNPEQALAFRMRYEEPAPVVARNVAANWAGSIALPAGWRIRARAVFNALVQPNVINLDVIGMLLPLANVERA